MRGFALLWLVGLSLALRTGVCPAHDGEAAKPEATKPPGTSRAGGSAMTVQPAPKSGSMPGRDAAVPQGRLGTEPVRKGRLGTPAPVDSKDRPPRPG